MITKLIKERERERDTHLGESAHYRASRRYGRCGVVPRYRTAWEGSQGAGEGHRAGLRRWPGVDQENGLLARCLCALDLDLRLLLDLIWAVSGCRAAVDVAV